MTPTTQPLTEYFEPTKTSDLIGKIGPDVSHCSTRSEPVLSLVTSGRIEAPIPPRFRTMDDVVADLERDPRWREEMTHARAWVADTVLKRKPLSLQKLRLRKGMSQAQLAEEIGTQQPHIARIEGGSPDIRLDTCRRLAAALGVDLNTLDLALRKQAE